MFTYDSSSELKKEHFTVVLERITADLVLPLVEGRIRECAESRSSLPLLLIDFEKRLLRFAFSLYPYEQTGQHLFAYCSHMDKTLERKFGSLLLLDGPECADSRN